MLAVLQHNIIGQAPTPHYRQCGLRGWRELEPENLGVPKNMSRTQTIKVYNINGSVCYHVTPRQAREMIEAGEVVALRRRGTKPKPGIFDAIQLKFAQGNRRNSGATITPREMEANAFGKGFNALGPGDSIRELERAIEKVDGWPDEHDTKAVCISAGRVIQPQPA